MPPLKYIGLLPCAATHSAAMRGTASVTSDNQKWTEGSGGTTLLLYFAFALVRDSRGIAIVNFTFRSHYQPAR